MDRKEKPMKSLNINDTIKVKLNEVGLAIYADRAKEINKKFEESNIKHRCPVSPKTDVDGFVKFQLWDLMKLYGKHLELTSTPPLILQHCNFKGFLLF